MSKIFYDHLVILEDVDEHIKSVASSTEEKEELWQIVDEIVHHRVLSSILGKLEHKHHDEFLEKYHMCPYDDGLIEYLSHKINHDVEEVIKNEVDNLSSEILQEVFQITKGKDDG